VRGLRALLGLLLLASLGLGGPARAADPLTQGLGAAATGRWEEARAALRAATVGPTRAQALLALAELELSLGRFAAAGEWIEEAGLVPGLEAPAALLTGRSLRAQGRYAAARTAFAESLRIDPALLAAGVELGTLELALGRRAQALQVLEPLLAQRERGARQSAHDLVLLGRAAVALGRIRAGFDALDQATVAAPDSVEAHLELALAALSRDDLVHAQQGFAAALQRNPRHPRVLVGAARLRERLGEPPERVEELLAQAVEQDPGCPEAWRLRAELALADQRSAAARAALAPALERNPNDLEALALLAASYSLEDDGAALRRVEQQVRALHPRPAALYVTLATVAERAYRYPDAVRLARKALELDPDHWPALLPLGINLTRTGHEAEGRRALERSYEQNPYSVQVTNLLNLFERFLAPYRTLRVGPFSLRGHEDELPLLTLWVAPLLQESWEALRKVWGFTPKTPLAVEIFHEPELFGLRSVGLPAVMSHGISFGGLVTARSPATNDFNWAQVLSHELSHIFGLQRSRHRVPRWFTEGTAEVQARRLRPAWDRHHEEALHAALRAGTLPRLADLDQAFTHAAALGDVLVAYQQAAWGVDFLCERWGDAIVPALHLPLARGQRVPAAVEQATGLRWEELEQRYRAWVGQRLAPLDAGWSLDPQRYRDAAAIARRVAERPEDPEALADAAWSLLLQGPQPPPDPAEALVLARRALARAPKAPAALHAAARAALSLGRSTEAGQHVAALRAVAGEGRTQLSLEAELALARGDELEARPLLLRAWAAGPAEPRLARLLLRLAESTGDAAERLEALQRVAAVDQHDPRVALRAARALFERGEPAAAAPLLRQALESGLFLPAVHALGRDLALAQQDAAAALRHEFSRLYLEAAVPHAGAAAAGGPAAEPSAGEVEFARALRASGGSGAAQKALLRGLRGQERHRRVRQVLARLQAAAQAAARP